MSKMDVCPKCKKPIDIGAQLKDKLPIDIWGYNTPRDFVELPSKIRDYNIIKCPTCGLEYRSSIPRFFGFIKPSAMVYVYIGFVSLILLLMLLSSWDVIPYNSTIFVK